MNETMNPSRHSHASPAGNEQPAAPPGVESHPAIDPVCGMKVKPSSPHRVEHEGREVAFCSRGCLEKFKAEPGRYAARPDEAAPAETEELTRPSSPHAKGSTQA